MVDGDIFMKSVGQGPRKVQGRVGWANRMRSVWKLSPAREESVVVEPAWGKAKVYWPLAEGPSIMRPLRFLMILQICRCWAWQSVVFCELLLVWTIFWIGWLYNILVWEPPRLLAGMPERGIYRLVVGNAKYPSCHLGLALKCNESFLDGCRTSMRVSSTSVASFTIFIKYWKKGFFIVGDTSYEKIRIREVLPVGRVHWPRGSIWRKALLLCPFWR